MKHGGLVILLVIVATTGESLVSEEWSYFLLQELICLQ